MVENMPTIGVIKPKLCVPSPQRQRARVWIIYLYAVDAPSVGVGILMRVWTGCIVNAVPDQVQPASFLLAVPTAAPISGAASITKHGAAKGKRAANRRKFRLTLIVRKYPAHSGKGLRGSAARSDPGSCGPLARSGRRQDLVSSGLGP